MQTTRIVRSGRTELIRNHIEGSYYRDVWLPGKYEQVERFDTDETRTVRMSPEVGAGINNPDASFAGGWLNQWKTQLLLTAGDASYRSLLQRGELRNATPAAGSDPGSLVLGFEAKKRGDFRFQRATFSPRHSYLVTRFETDFVKPYSPEPKKVHTAICDAVDFWELGHGIALPKTIRVTSTDEPGVVGLFHLRDVVINRPIDDGELKLPIPSGTIVSDLRSQKYHIWGKDGPSRTFASNQEFMDWSRAQQRQGFSRRSPWSWGIAGLVAACLLVIAALFNYRRRLRASY